MFGRPSALAVANLRDSGHNLRSWAANLRNPGPNLRNPSPNLRTGVLKEVLHKAQERMHRIAKSPEFRGNTRCRPARHEPVFTTPMRRFALRLCRFGGKSRRFATGLRRFEARLRKFAIGPPRFEARSRRPIDSAQAPSKSHPVNHAKPSLRLFMCLFHRKQAATYINSTNTLVNPSANPTPTDSSLNAFHPTTLPPSSTSSGCIDRPSLPPHCISRLARPPSQTPTGPPPTAPPPAARPIHAEEQITTNRHADTLAL